MTRKKANDVGPHLLLLLLLLIRLDATHGSTLEKPASIVIGTPQYDGNYSTSDVNVTTTTTDNATEAASVRAQKAILLPVRKIETYANWLNSINVTTHSVPIDRRQSSREDESNQVDQRSSSTKQQQQQQQHEPVTLPSNHRKSQEKRKQYQTSEDYDNQNYNLEYYPPQVAHDYDTLDYSVVASEDPNYAPPSMTPSPWNANDPGYFGPPLTPPSLGGYSSSDSKDPQNNYRCHCPKAETRQACVSPVTTFLGLLGALGGNLWALAGIIATSSAPIVIPLLALKAIIIPLKILKFLKLIKIFFKLFVVLPFFARVVYPALANTFSLQNFLFQKDQHPIIGATHEHPLMQAHRGDADFESISGRNEIEGAAMWDLRGCPARVACELGAFLAPSTEDGDFPGTLKDYLERRAESGEAEEEMERYRTFKAFVISLGKRWTKQQCQQSYRCPLLY